MTVLETLSLADLRTAVDEYARYVQDHQGDTEGRAERNAAFHKLRDELNRRVAEIAAEAVAA